MANNYNASTQFWILMSWFDPFRQTIHFTRSKMSSGRAAEEEADAEADERSGRSIGSFPFSSRKYSNLAHRNKLHF